MISVVLMSGFVFEVSGDWDLDALFCMDMLTALVM